MKSGGAREDHGARALAVLVGAFLVVAGWRGGRDDAGAKNAASKALLIYNAASVATPMRAVSDNFTIWYAIFARNAFLLSADGRIR